MTSLKAGHTSKLTQPQGLGEGIGHVPHGTHFEIVEIVDQGTPGVGTEHSEPVAIVAIDEPTLIVNDEGNVEEGTTRRHLSMGVSEFKRLTGGTDGG